MSKFNFRKYTIRLKEFLDYCVENYFNDDEPTNLNEILRDVGLGHRYTKFYQYTKRCEPIDDAGNETPPLKSLLDYETFIELSRIDPKKRAPLQIRAFLMGEKLPNYNKLKKIELINLLIDRDNSCR